MPSRKKGSLAVSLDTAPMEAKLVESLPTGDGWQFEPKWDGFRCLAFRDGANVGLLRLSPYTRKRAEAQRWLARSGGALDGVIAKRADGRKRR